VVSKILSFVLIVALVLNSVFFRAPCFAASGEMGLSLRWIGSHSESCQKLFELFLSELRSIAADRVIELEAHPEKNPQPSSLRALNAECFEDGGKSESIRIRSATDNEEPLVLHYVVKANGFDATDWLPFQQRYLRSEPDLSLLSATGKTQNLPHVDENVATSTVSESSSGRIWQKWWFWALVGGVGATAYVLTRQSTQHTGMNVEIH
jgi:hypothetical protein